MTTIFENGGLEPIKDFLGDSGVPEKAPGATTGTSHEALASENAGTRIMMAEMNARIVSFESVVAAPRTPPRNTAVSPAEQAYPTPGDGPIVAMWSPGTSPERRREIFQEHASSPAASIPAASTPSKKLRAPVKKRTKPPLVQPEGITRKKRASPMKKEKEPQVLSYIKGGAAMSTLPKKPIKTERTVAELYKADFKTLTQVEKARLLLPLLQGIDPLTGEKDTQAGTLAQELEDTIVGPAPEPNAFTNPSATNHTFDELMDFSTEFTDYDEPTVNDDGNNNDNTEFSAVDNKTFFRNESTFSDIIAATNGNQSENNDFSAADNISSDSDTSLEDLFNEIDDDQNENIDLSVFRNNSIVNIPAASASSNVNQAENTDASAVDKNATVDDIFAFDKLFNNINANTGNTSNSIFDNSTFNSPADSVNAHSNQSENVGFPAFETNANAFNVEAFFKMNTDVDNVPFDNMPTFFNADAEFGNNTGFNNTSYRNNNAAFDISLFDNLPAFDANAAFNNTSMFDSTLLFDAAPAFNGVNTFKIDDGNSNSFSASNSRNSFPEHDMQLALQAAQTVAFGATGDMTNYGAMRQQEALIAHERRVTEGRRR